jgi:hypothetical protein
LRACLSRAKQKLQAEIRKPLTNAKQRPTTMRRKKRAKATDRDRDNRTDRERRASGQQHDRAEMDRSGGPHETYKSVIGLGNKADGEPSVSKCILLVCLLFCMATSPTTAQNVSPNFNQSPQQQHHHHQQNAAQMQRHNQIVFPGRSMAEQHSRTWPSSAQQHRQQAQQQPIIYINPQPSTLSGKYQQQTATADERMFASNKTPKWLARNEAGSYQPPIGDRFQQSKRQASALLTSGSSPSLSRL